MGDGAGERLRANLAQLAELRDKGALSEAQFETARTVLFERAGLIKKPDLSSIATLPDPTPAVAPVGPVAPVATAPSPMAAPFSYPERAVPDKGIGALLYPKGFVEIAFTVLIGLGVLGLVFLVLNNLTSQTVRPDRVDVATMVPTPPGGFEPAPDAIPTIKVPDGKLTADQFFDVVGGNEIARANARAIFVRGFKQTWRRPDGAISMAVVALHPSPDIASSYLGQTRGRAGGDNPPTVAGAPDSVIVFKSDGELKFSDALVVRGPISIEVVMIGTNVTATEGQDAAAGALPRLSAVPTQPCFTNSGCRARQLPIIQLLAMPIGGLALGLEGARRRRLGIGNPLNPEGVLGVMSRGRRSGKVFDRTGDTVFYEDSAVVAKAPWEGPEMLIGAVLAGWLGAYAGRRAQARRDADRRNEVARVPQNILALRHSSNLVIPYEQVTRVDVKCIRKRGRADIRLADGRNVRLNWRASFNKRNDVPRVIATAVGTRAVIKETSASAIEVLGFAIIGMSILGSVAALVG
jgi:hypothetical protein